MNCTKTIFRRFDFSVELKLLYLKIFLKNKVLVIIRQQYNYEKKIDRIIVITHNSHQ